MILSSSTEAQLTKPNIFDLVQKNLCCIQTSIYMSVVYFWWFICHYIFLEPIWIDVQYGPTPEILSCFIPYPLSFSFTVPLIHFNFRIARVGVQKFLILQRFKSLSSDGRQNVGINFFQGLLQEPRLQVGLLIVFVNDRFLFRFQNNRFVFRKKRLFLKTTHSF